MKNFIILFLALLWACFAAEDTAHKFQHRELMKDWKAMCADLRSYGYGRHTFYMSGFKARWARRWDGVTMGEVSSE